MTVSHLSELLPFLDSIDAAPRKSLSQNFLIDANIVRKIATLGEVTSEDHILEIGPGPGALTQELLRLGAHVTAVEMDRRFADALHRLQTPEKRLSVIQADFLKCALPLGPCKVIANLPYHITAPILEKLCMHHQYFRFALVMVQKEVAERIVAKPGTKTISAFTHFLKIYAESKIVGNISKSCFYPAPQVDSCLVKLEFRKPETDHPLAFTAMIRKAFQARRKMLRASLGISNEFATFRPENLTFEDWIKLSKETL